MSLYPRINKPTAGDSLAGLLSEAGLSGELLRQASLTGPDPVVRLRPRAATAAQAAIAASGLAAAQILQDRGGPEQSVEIGTAAALAALRSYRYFGIDGRAPAEHGDWLTGFYRTGDDRWVYLHCNFPNLKHANLAVLVANDDKDSVEAAVRQRGADALEQALFDGGGCGAAVRTRDEWTRLPQWAAVRAEPLLAIERIGDGPVTGWSAAARPLDGVRALDLTRVLAGPTASKVLAGHGATVLRVERQDLADSGFFDLDTGLGKRSTFLDLRQSSERSHFEHLLSDCDVFVQAYRPGALAGLGYDHAALAGLRPGIVTVNLCAWGRTGPWAGRRGYDTVVQSANGMAWDGKGRPSFLPVAAQDYLAGYLMAFGAMVALRRRALEGGSWRVDVSLARVGEWLHEHGNHAADVADTMPAELDDRTLQALLQRSVSPVGELTHLVPMPTMSATPARWDAPAVPRGHHPPAWA